MRPLSQVALRRIARVLLLSQIVALLVVAGLGIAFSRSIQEYEESDDWVEHTHEVLRTIERVRITLLRGGVALRNYALAPQEQSITRLREASAEARAAAAKLQDLVKDHEAQSALAHEVRAETDEVTGWYLSSAVIAEREGAEAVRGPLLERVGKDSAGRLRELLGSMDAAEQRLLDTRQEAQAKQLQSIKHWAVGLGAGFFVFMLWTITHAARLFRSAHRDIKQLANKAQRDPLTQLFNRRALDDAVAKLGTTPMSVLVFDVDGFKPINDTHGHAAGDEVLRAMAARVREQCRDHDVTARVGGDEFVIVLPGIAEVETMQRIRDRLAKALAEPMDIRGVRIAVTASIGYAVSRGDRSFDELLKVADEMSYADKKGRKTVHA